MSQQRGSIRIVLSSPLIISRGARRLREPQVLEQLHGLTAAKEPLVEYFTGEVANLGLRAGFLRCVFDAEKREVRIVTEYTSPGRLSKKEMNALVGTTHGQWLDGVGESFFDDFCDLNECSVDIGAKTRVVQEPGAGWQPGKKSKVKLVRPKRRPPAQGNSKALSKRLFEATSAKQVQALLDAGADSNWLDDDGEQPLHLFNLLRQPKVVRLLLDHGAAVNGRVKDTEQTPLMVAASYGLVATVKLLLSAGASVALKDGYGKTALEHAAEGIPALDIRPKPAVIDLLMKAGGRVTPATLNAAASQPNARIVQLVLDTGADVNARVDGHHTALSTAVYVGNTRVVKLLLEAGADPNCRVYQQTALAAALQSGFTAIAKLLKAAGAVEGVGE